MEAEKEEQSQKVREEKTAFLAKRNRDAIEGPRYSNCGKPFHTKEICCVFYPELKESLRGQARGQKLLRSKRRIIQAGFQRRSNRIILVTLCRYNEEDSLMALSVCQP